MKCPNCGADIVQSDRFCTHCGFSLVGGGEPVTSSPEQAAQQAFQEAQQPTAQQSGRPFAQQPTAQQAAEKVVSPHSRRGLIVALSILGVIVVVVSLIISLMAFHVVANPLQKPRLVSLKISAPRYQEGSDSKIPLHITGRTVSGRVISQHVYVSPKAASVRLEPGQYTVTVEASPLLSSGDVYRIPQPLKIDTASGSNFVGESKPVKQDLKFEVKPANEVTKEDIARAEKFAKNTDQNPQTLKIVKSAFSRRKVAEAYNKILDTFSKDSSNDARLSYSLHDINADGVPELLVNRLIPSEEWVQVNDAHALLSVWTVSDAELGVKQVEGTIPLYDGIGNVGLTDGYYPDGHGIRSTPFDADISGVYTISNLRVVSKMVPGLPLGQSEEKATYLPLSDRDLLDYYAMKSDSPIKQYLPELSPEHVLRLSDASARGQLPISGTVKKLTWKQVHDYSLKKIKGLSPWYETHENIDTSVVNQEEEWLQLDDPDFESLDQYRYPNEGTREWRKKRPYFHLLAEDGHIGNLSLSQYDGKHVILLSEGIYAPRNEWWLALPRIIVNSVITL